MKLIVGLGNPGREYKYTRHNAGFLALDAYAESLNVSIKKHKFHALYEVVDEYILVKPQTFMNLSGVSVKLFCEYFELEPAHDLIVFVDDVHLAFGTVRVRPEGSAGGHNGLRSLIHELGTQQFTRIRMGIGKPEHPSQLADYVLAPFSEEERRALDEVCDRVIDACTTVLEDGVVPAMNKWNS